MTYLYPVSVCLIPSSKTAIGRAAYLSAITTVFGHPGRRFGQVVETLILILCGTLLGLVWSILGTYFASLVIKNDPAAAYAIKGIFLSVALIIHGFFRSKTPRLFVFVLLLIIVTIVTLTSTSTVVKSVSVTQILYPILLGTGANLLVNLCVFPEFSSSFLGKTTIDTLHETTSALDKAGDYFIGLQKKKNPSESGFHRPHKQEEEAQNDNRHFLYLIHRMIASLVFKPKDQPTKGNTSTGQAVSLPDLTSSKAKLRTRLGNCKAAQSECNFELAFGVLPPENLKPISARSMKRLVANTIAVIGACESKFALVGDEDAGEVDLEKSNRDYQSRDSKDLHTGAYTYLQPQLVKSSAPAISKPHSQRTDIDLIKPKREIEFADIRLLQDLLNRIEKPYKEFMASIKQTVACITISIACSYVSVPHESLSQLKAIGCSNSSFRSQKASRNSR